MARVYIPELGVVNLPDGLSQQELMDRARQLQDAAREEFKIAEPDYRELGLGQLVKGGFKRSVSGLGSTITDLLPAVAASSLGFKDYAREQLEEAAQKRAEAEAESPTAYRSYKQIEGAGDVPGFVAETVGELGPDILAFLTGAGAGSAVGRRVAAKGVEKAAEKKAAEAIARKKLDDEAAKELQDRMVERALASKVGREAAEKGASIGQKTGLIGSSAGINIPDTFQSIYEDTGNMEPLLALTVGSVVSMLDTYLPGKILQQLGPAGKARIANELINKSTVVPNTFKKEFGFQLAKTAGGESLTESAQETLQILASQIAGDEKGAFSTENVDRIITSALKGAVGGATYGAPGAAVEAKRDVAAQKARAAEIKAERDAAAGAIAGQAPTTQALGFTPGLEGYQPDLFPAEKAAAETEQIAKDAIAREAAAQYRPEFELGQKLTAEEQAAPVQGELDLERIAEQAGLDLTGGRTAPQAAIERRVAAENAAQVQAIGDRKARARLELESAIAETDARVESGEIKRREAARLDILLPIIENEAIKNTEDAFKAALRRAGYAVTDLNEREAALVEKANAFKEALAMPETVEVEPSAPSELTEEITGIKEKGEKGPAGTPKPKEPKQLSLEGVGRPQPAEVTEEAAVEEAPISTVLDADTLNTTGLSPRSGFYKQLVNKDMANPQDQVVVADVLSRVRTNAGVSPATKQAIESIANRAFTALATQQEMFGPRGGVAKGVKSDKRTGRTITEPAGRGVSVPSRPEPTSAAKGPAETRGRGLAADRKPADRTGAGKARESDTLEPTFEEDIAEQKRLLRKLEAARKAERRAEDLSENSKEKIALRKAREELDAFSAKANLRMEKRTQQLLAESEEGNKRIEKLFEELDAKQTARPAPKAPVAKEAKKPTAPKAAKEAVEAAEKAKAEREEAPEKDFGDVMSKGYLSFSQEDITDIDDNVKVTELLGKKRKLSPIEEAAQTYFSKMPRMVDNLVNISYDLVFDTPQFRREGETSAEAQFFQGMNGAKARLAADWVHGNLSPETDAKFRGFIRQLEISRDTYTDAQLMELIARSWSSGFTETQLDETVKDYFKAQEESDLAFKEFARGLNIPQKVSTNKELMALVKRAWESGFSKEDINEAVKLQTKSRAGIREATKRLKKLESDAVVNIGFPLHPAIAGALMNGDLTTALKMLSATSDGFVSRLARVLTDAVLGTTVEVQDNLKDEAGKPVPGYYDPKTNTIYLDSKTGMRPHVLLHEAVHAATSHILDNPSHPVTKQLQQIFDSVKDSLGSAYGATNLDEFVAELKANPELQALLRSINPNGSKISAWQRIVRTISNFFRRLVGMEQKPLDSAFDVADRLIDAILSPAPESRDAGLLFAAANSGRASELFDTLGDLIAKAPGMNQERADHVHEFLKNSVGGTFRNFFLSTLTLQALTDVAKKHLPMAPQLDREVNERSGYEYKMNRSIEPLVERAEKWAKDNPSMVELFNDVVYDSTIEKVDPSKPRTDYKAPEKQKEWDRLNKMYQRLGGRGQELYRNMRDGYKAMYDEIIKSIEERIDANVADKDRANIIKRDILEKLAKKGNIDPYFPLARNGIYWLSYNAKDKNGQMDKFVEAFETERERTRAMEEYKKAGATDIQAFSKLSELNYRNVPSNSFVNSILQILETNKVPEATTEEVMRLFLNTLPETSFAQSFQSRKETSGFRRDAIRALREKMYRTSHQIANMRYAAKLNAILRDMEEYATKVGKGAGEEAQRDNRVINEYVKEFERRINYINNPTISKWAQVATSIGFNMTLGFNVSSAVVNLTQIPLIVFPYLGGKYGFAETAKAINDAYKIHLNSGFKQEVEMIGSKGEKIKLNAGPALDNYDFDDPKLPAEVKRLKTLARIASEQGQLNRSQLFDILEVDGRENALAKINAASGFVFHHGERLNRQVSLIAAYNLELNRLAKDIKSGKITQEQAEIDAANQAIFTTEMTNGGIAAASAPRIAQSSLGKVLFMFKRYGVSMYYLLFKTAREMLKGETPEVRQAAMRQIAGIYGTAALFAGLQGLPLFGVAALVYNMFAGDDEDDMETATRKYFGEFMYKGLANYVTNTEIASRTGLSDLIIRDSGKQDSQTLALTMMEMLGGPVFGVASKVERGINMINEGNVERGIENILPTSLGNILKGIRYATEGTTTLRGDPITGEVNAWNVGAQIFGFAPADYTRQLEINAREKGIDKKANEQRTKILRQYYTASRVGDIEGMNEAREDLFELGRKHPGLKISEETIRNSMAQHKRTTKEMINGVRYSPRMLKEIKENLAEYED